MLDSDPTPLAVSGSLVTADRIAEARACLLGLRSLLADVRESAHRLVPPSTSAWRSEAADGYAQGLDALRARVMAARDGLVDAEAALVDRIRRMEAQLEREQLAASVPPTNSEASWTIR